MKIIIFDMDGVIFDSERVVYEGWKEMAEKYGFTNLEIPYWKCIGVNASRTKEIFLDFYGKDFPYDKICEERRQEYHRRYDHGKLPLKPYVKELLQYLKEEGYFIAIASSTKTETVENQIKAAGLIDFFDRIVGGDQVTKSKPEPDIFWKAAEEITDDFDSVYVIEDSYNGIRAAKRAGMRPIMVPDLLLANEEMKELAEVIVNDLAEVRDYLEQKKK